MESAGKMPKHRTQRIDHKKESDFLAPVEEIHRVKIALCIDARMRVTGKYSGQEYLFEKAGAVVDVDATDVEWLLEKRQGERQCCGGTEPGNRVFQLA